MRTHAIAMICIAFSSFLSHTAFAFERELRSPPRKLTTEQARVAANNYQNTVLFAMVKTARDTKTITRLHFAVKA